MTVARKNMSELANSFICLSASSEHPIMEKEKTLVNILTEGLAGKHWLCIKTDDSCGEELRIDIAYYDCSKIKQDTNIKGLFYSKTISTFMGFRLTKRTAILQ